MPPSPTQEIHGGTGRITVSSHGLKAVFSELSAAYPLKLLSPRAFENRVAIVYLLSYGGGLVSGDQVDLRVHVTGEAKLVLLSQGSTKIFKTRPGRRLATVNGEQIKPGTPSRQVISFTVSQDGALFLLPDPVTCFRDASYHQIQTFHIARGASVAILDWVTSGRKSLGEEWVFSQYYSVNEIFLDGVRVAKDVMLLEDNAIPTASGTRRTLAQRLAPYACYAMLFLIGPQLQTTIDHLTKEYESISVMKTRAPEHLIWSLSPLVTGQGSGVVGAVVRVAGKEPESVKRWFSSALAPIAEHIGLEDVHMK
ncbi:UreD-domain-containing protein [Cylindrobasidium torrendii FP15055 ss-10]|uniref:UreD-domain-containing protein n=1 Tax=Cylindrobasidium torrendii FP15055 ss-10 TaxID=1314674 RepID=A0A0D7AZF8_9AGAR|nr:UreD-domain-containing protein [Cylindrobasidium torrendii FP15055 ss-10]